MLPVHLMGNDVVDDSILTLMSKFVTSFLTACSIRLSLSGEGPNDRGNIRMYLCHILSVGRKIAEAYMDIDLSICLYFIGIKWSGRQRNLSS